MYGVKTIVIPLSVTMMKLVKEGKKIRGKRPFTRDK